MEKKKVCICITTYNRPGMVSRLVRHFKKKIKTLFDDSWYFEIRVYDDHSDKPLDIQGIEYIRFPENHGRFKFWKLISGIFNDLRDTNFDYYLQIADDSLLTDRYPLSAIEQWDAIDDPDKILLNPFIDKKRAGNSSWTSKDPELMTFGDYRIWRSNYVDCGWIAGKRLFEELEFHITPQPMSRWGKRKTKSSGVGQDMTTRLNDKGLHMYQCSEGLIYQVDHPSVMFDQPTQRESVIKRKDPVFMGVASIPSRIKTLENTIASVIGQVDHLYVTLNGYESVPEYLNHDKITVFRSQDVGDYGDAGKFYAAERCDGYFFTIDDDIIYPEGYVDNTVDAIDRYHRECVVTYHGRILKNKVRRYYRDKEKILHCRSYVGVDTYVNVGGSGVMAFHTTTLLPSISDFPKPNMADIWVSKLANNEGVPVVVLAHPSNYVVGQETEWTIFEKHKNDDRVQTKVVNSVLWKSISIHTAERGVALISTGNDIVRAISACLSIKKTKAVVPVVLYCGNIPDEYVDLCNRTFDRVYPYIDIDGLMEQPPFNKTLYLSNDSIVFWDVDFSPLFEGKSYSWSLEDPDHILIIDDDEPYRRHDKIYRHEYGRLHRRQILDNFHGVSHRGTRGCLARDLYNESLRMHYNKTGIKNVPYK